ncbi:MAG: Gfo/Idh/MocA family protein, partial [Sphingobacterium sp.]
IHPGFKLKGIVERSHKHAQENYSDIISYNSVHELIDDPEIELVIVNTPNDTHVDFAAKALRAGKHVLIEKPFAPTLRESNYLFELAKEVNKVILPFHNRRFDSDFLSLKEILTQNLVGKPIELHIRFDRFKPEIGKKLFKESNRPASGILFDLGSHLLDQVISIFGRPKAISKISGKYRENSEVDDYGTIVMNYSNGLNVFLTVSLLVADPQASFVLHGDNGSFIKTRTDVQEGQLIQGILPNSPEYGIEKIGSEGILSTKGKDDQFFKQRVLSQRGNYMELFNAVYETLRNHKPYFVTKDQINWQLEILEPAK